jgi:D-sedoheptulose 7-phosphate isomerase
VHDFIRTYLETVATVLDAIPVDTTAVIVDVLFDAYSQGREIFAMGNGGSAASASHFVCDLAKGTITEGVPRVRATCLSDNVPLLTAWANDTNYTDTFGEILRNHAVLGDVVVGCTASGQSPNIINAMKTARDLGAKTIVLVGYDGGKVRDECDIALVIPSNDITQIEDVQTLLFHLIACALKEKMKGIRARDLLAGSAGL